MPAPYYTTQKEKEEYFNSKRPFYKGLGYEDDQVDDIVKAKINDKKMDDEFAYNQAGVKFFDETQGSLATGKYGAFDPTGNKIYRVISAMYKPETSLENVRYNERLALKLNSKEGFAEVIQDALTILATANHARLEKLAKGSPDPTTLGDEYNPIVLGFVAQNIYEIANELNAEAKRNGEPDVVPREVIEHAQLNKSFYETYRDTQDNYLQAASVYHLVLPRDIKEDMAGGGFAFIQYLVSPKKIGNDMVPFDVNLPAGAQPKPLNDEYIKLQNDYGKYMGYRFTKAKDSIPFRKLKNADSQEICDKFYQKCKDRMAYDKEHHDIVIEWAKEKMDVEGLLFEAKANKLENIDESNKDNPICKENNRKINERQKALHEKAVANYGQKVKPSVEEVYQMVKADALRTGKNKNYDKMLAALEEMRELVKDGPLKAKDGKAFEEQLNILETASHDYLKVKMAETRSFSDLALRRIDAAKMVSAFVRGKKGQLALANNKAFKEELDVNYTQADSEKMFKHYRSAFNETGKLENYVKAYTARSVMRRYLTESIQEGHYKQIDMKLETERNMRAFKLLYNSSDRFQFAINSGDMRGADEALRAEKEAREERERNARMKEAREAAKKAAEKAGEPAEVQQEVKAPVM